MKARSTSGMFAALGLVVAMLTMLAVVLIVGAGSQGGAQPGSTASTTQPTTQVAPAGPGLSPASTTPQGLPIDGNRNAVPPCAWQGGC